MNSYYVHFSRLEEDYHSMLMLNSPLVTWESRPESSSGQYYPARYLVTYHMLAPTVDGIADRHQLELDCSSLDYPLRFLPVVRFITPVIKHPHVYSDGSRRVCLGGAPLSETLGALCIRLARFLQYDPTLIDPRSLASPEFYRWYLQYQERLPLDRSPLPTLLPTSGLRQIHRRGAGTPRLRPTGCLSR